MRTSRHISMILVVSGVRETNSVKIHVELRLNGQTILEGDESLDFGAASGAGSAVGLVALVGAASGTGPLVGPVAVEIGPRARSAGVGLTRLAPHAVGALGVDEAVRVDNGKDVKVIFG